jgi:hypothetical protein
MASRPFTFECGTQPDVVGSGESFLLSLKYVGTT